MRNLCLAFMFVLAAVILAGCPTAIQKATTTLDQITIVTRNTQVGYKAVVGQQLTRIATEEQKVRTDALAQSGCPLDPAQQTAEGCKKIVAEAQTKYDARKGKVVVVATKLDTASALVYAALLTAVDILILVRDGAKDQWPKLTALVAEVVKVAQALADAWGDFKKTATSY